MAERSGFTAELTWEIERAVVLRATGGSAVGRSANSQQQLMISKGRAETILHGPSPS